MNKITELNTNEKSCKVQFQAPNQTGEWTFGVSVVSDSVFGGDWKSQVKMIIEEVEKKKIEEIEIETTDDEDDEDDLVVLEKKVKGKKEKYDDSSDEDNERDDHEDHGHNPDYIE